MEERFAWYFAVAISMFLLAGFIEGIIGLNSVVTFVVTIVACLIDFVSYLIRRRA